MEESSKRSGADLTALALLAVVALAWGLNWSAMKRVLAELPPWSYPAAGLLIGGAGLMAIAALCGQRLRPQRGDWPRLLAIAFTNFTLWQVLAAYGISLLPAGRAATLNFTMPVWSILIGRFVLGERLTMSRVLSLALGVAGVALLIAGDMDAIAAAPLGVALMLACSLSWALATVLIKRYPVSLEPTAFTAWQMRVGGAPIALGAIVLEHDAWRPISATALFAFSYSVVFAWTLAYWAWTRAVIALPLAVSSLGVLAIPIVGVLGGIVLLGERPPPTDYGALALLGAALGVLVFGGRVRSVTSREL